jgi:hypothetical protein
MKNSKDDNCFESQHKEYPVWETPGNDTPNFGPPAKTRVLARMGYRALNCESDLDEEFFSQPFLLILIPDSSISNIRFCLRAND